MTYFWQPLYDYTSSLWYYKAYYRFYFILVPNSASSIVVHQIAKIKNRKHRIFIIFPNIVYRSCSACPPLYHVAVIIWIYLFFLLKMSNTGFCSWRLNFGRFLSKANSQPQQIMKLFSFITYHKWPTQLALTNP